MMEDRIARLEAKVRKAYIVANNVLYFSDNSDYSTALYQIANTLSDNPETDFAEASNIGVNYIED